MKIAKIVPNEFMNESRDERELTVCQQLGAEVIVFAKGKTGKNSVIEQIGGFTVYRCSTRPLGTKVFNTINRSISLFTWAFCVRKVHPDIVSGHDLTGLTIGWISSWFMKKKPLFVYDSHEFELGRNAKRNQLKYVLIKFWEGFLIKRSALVVMVNDSIADEVKRIYRLKERPLVVRNIPPKWKIDRKECEAVREKIEKEIGQGKLLLYHGSVTKERGIERLIKILTYDDSYHLFILGNAGEETYRNSLKQYADRLGVAKRVLFHDAVPHQILWRYIGASDLSVMLLSGQSKSYYYGLPNKLFESIQAGVPFLSSDFPEFKRIIEGYHVGLTCNPENEMEIKKTLKKIFDEKAMKDFKNNTLIASNELCWEKEKEQLEKAYKALFKRRIAQIRS